MSILERTSYTTVIPPQDVGTADVQGGIFVDASRARRVMARATAANLTDGQTLTVQLMQATAADGTAAKALSSVVTQTAPAEGELGSVNVEADVGSLDISNGFKFVGAKIGSGTNGKVGSADIVLLERDSIAS